ncbi:ElaA protein [Lishizhenia tianjinensis]|uniref:ElaA protein n=1 Tax=Lishizhenia tianjinensis TaxID=477690 RepID=A0A1I6XA72_9FLAO|nr:GNAT family N-acetyltransferase [Lishizhenia tianjinensis]SFT34684.1 ElaA protein [Lishizhenia tianjinensis]
MKIEIKKWEELSPLALHDLIALRINIFVVEQNCPYPELDGKDLLADHLVIHNETKQLIGTARILAPGVSYKEVSIGRVAIAESERGKAIGHELMRAALDFIGQKYGKVAVKISAQEHLQNYYQQHGFVTVSEMYLEDDIPHVAMKRS